jgi:hypothetical protein
MRVKWPSNRFVVEFKSRLLDLGDEAEEFALLAGRERARDHFAFAQVERKQELVEDCLGAWSVAPRRTPWPSRYLRCRRRDKPLADSTTAEP